MKKFVAVFLSAVLTVGNGYFAFAQSSEIPLDLEQAIVDVKTYIDIPEEYSEFEYSINNYDDFDKYYLTWSKKIEDNVRDRIELEVDTDGNIYSYGKFDHLDDANFLNKKSKEECLNSAQKFLQKILPNDYQNFKLEHSFSTNRFSFRLYKKGIPVHFGILNIVVDKDTLDIQSYNFDKANLLNGEFEDVAGVIGENDAKKLYIENAKFEPKYVLNYNYTTGEKNIILVYEPNVFYSKAVDAKTGDLIALDFDGLNYYNEMEEKNLKAEMASDAGGAEREVILSEKELEKIRESEKILTKEQADLEIKKAVPENIKFGEIESCDLFQDFVDSGTYSWTITYSNGYASIDAKTKKIKSFCVYDDGNDEEDYDNFEKMNVRKEKALQFIQKLEPDKINNIEFSEESSNSSWICFSRVVNGLKFEENSINVTFDKNDNITSYLCNWNDSLEFPKPDGLISSEEAFDVIGKRSKFALTYEFTKQNVDRNIVLGYSLIEEAVPYISAKTGEELDYNGKAYKVDEPVLTEYSDIKGHWCEKYVKTLLNNGYYINRDKFLPDEKITRKEFFGYIFQNYYSSIDDFNELRKSSNNPEEIKECLEFFNRESEFITKKELCCFIISQLNYTNISKEDVFKNPFSDVDENADFFGAAVIADSLGIVLKDENNNFNPDEFVTNAEAARAIYSSMLLKK